MSAEPHDYKPVDEREKKRNEMGQHTAALSNYGVTQLTNNQD